MKKQMIEAAARLRAMPAWTKGLMLVILILLVYQLFLDLSYLADIDALGPCPDCSR
ncbi:MAG: hypothetical protein RQ748_09025 [Elusimicrobiales bacterium]|nr:hypothetical protein [Elusimicrobiales bacterium]